MTKAIMFGMVGGLAIAMGTIVLPADSFSVQNEKAASGSTIQAVTQDYQETAQVYTEPTVVQQEVATVGQGYGCDYVDGHHTGTCPYVDENHTDLCPFVDENYDGVCDLGNHHSYGYSSSTSNSTVSVPSQGTGYGRHHSEGGHHGGRHH